MFFHSVIHLHVEFVFHALCNLIGGLNVKGIPLASQTYK